MIRWELRSRYSITRVSLKLYQDIVKQDMLFVKQIVSVKIIIMSFVQMSTARILLLIVKSLMQLSFHK